MPTNKSARSNELIPAMMVFGVCGAIPAALLGMAASSYVSHRFGVPINAWQGMFLGACVGASIGVFRANLEFQRLSRLDRSSAFLGLKPLGDAFRGAVMVCIERLFSKQVKFLTAFSSDNESAKVVVGDVQLATQVVSKGQKRTGSQSYHSYVYFEFRDVQFPKFELGPESSLVRIMDSLHGQDIDFEDSIEFSSFYHLKSEDPVKCRELFDVSVRNAISRKNNWTIRGDRSWLVFLTKNRFKTVDDQKQFLNQCLGIASLFHEQAIGS